MANTKYRKAVKHFKAGDFDTSLHTAYAGLTLAKGKDKIAFYNLIGIIYHQLGLFNQAVKSFTESLQLDSENFQSWENLGIIYRRLNQFNQAEHCFLKALELNPLSDEALTSLGVVYLFIDEVGKAINCFEKSLKINSGWNITYGNLALAYALSNNFEKAEKTLQKAIFLGFENYEEIKERIDNLKFLTRKQKFNSKESYSDGDLQLH